MRRHYEEAALALDSPAVKLFPLDLSVQTQTMSRNVGHYQQPAPENECVVRSFVLPAKVVATVHLR